MDDGCCDAGSGLVQDGCFDRSSGSADKRSAMDVAAVVGRRRRESVADAERGVNSGRILEESAETPAMVRLDGAAGERSSHLVEQKTWE